jgi:hypothetical protein
MHSVKAMRHNGSMLGLWIIRTTEKHAETLLGKVQSDLYLFAFTSAVRASSCMTQLGAAGAPFYVCGANVEAIVHDARSSGVRGFIVDYDPSRACFVSAHPLPSEAAAARELR